MMNLPKLNTTPKYETYIPSMNKKVKFRPYLVKEEKILLIAMESKSNNQILNAIADTVLACIDEDIDRSKLTTFDIEFLFLQIRSKSVGEKSNIGITCQNCEKVNEIEVDIDKIEMKIPKVNKKIKLTDDINLQMKYPSFEDISTEISSMNSTEQAFAIVSKCIESIQTNDENYLIKDVPESEVIEFIDSLTSEQYQKIAEFINSIPRLEHDIKFKCNKCGINNNIKLEGIGDFFQ